MMFERANKLTRIVPRLCRAVGRMRLGRCLKAVCVLFHQEVIGLHAQGFCLNTTLRSLDSRESSSEGNEELIVCLQCWSCTTRLGSKSGANKMMARKQGSSTDLSKEKQSKIGVFIGHTFLPRGAVLLCDLGGSPTSIFASRTSD